MVRIAQLLDPFYEMMSYLLLSVLIIIHKQGPSLAVPVRIEEARIMAASIQAVVSTSSAVLVPGIGAMAADTFRVAMMARNTFVEVLIRRCFYPGGTGMVVASHSRD